MFITPKAIIPPEITTQVATVLHNASVFVKSKIASMQATAQITMQIVKTAKETARTKFGLIKPRLFLLSLGCGSGGVSISIHPFEIFQFTSYWTSTTTRTILRSGVA